MRDRRVQIPFIKSNSGSRDVGMEICLVDSSKRIACARVVTLRSRDSSLTQQRAIPS